MNYLENSISNIETFYAAKDGTELPVTLAISQLKYDKSDAGIIVVAKDITEQKKTEAILKLDEDRFEALLKINFMQDISERELAQHALEEVVRLSKSEGGYLHFFDDIDDTFNLYIWSEDAIKTCKAEDDSPYSISREECDRIAGPVINNDYQNVSDDKGHTEGHFALIRYMRIPIFDHDCIVAVAEVVNKKDPYDQSDVRQISLFMDSIWKILKNRKAEKVLRENQEMLARQHEKLNTLFGKVALAKKEWELTMDCVGDLILLTGEDGRIIRINKPAREFADRPYTEIIGRSWEELIQQQGLESYTFYAGGVEFYQKATGKWYLLNSYPFNSEDLGYSGTVITLHETTEIKQVSEKLEETTRRIEKNSEKLRNALEQISLLIQNVTYQKNYDITFTNPYLKKCYEVKNCNKKNCLCYGKEAVRCWQVAGTFCGSAIQGAFAQKYQNCAECRVFKDATADPIYQIGEQFNNMMHVLEIKNRQLEDAYSELKATQAQILQREKMASIGQLAAGVAHEINNPMGFISSNLGTLEKYLIKLTEFITAQCAVTESFKSAEASGQINDLRKKLKIDYILDDIQQLINESLDGADRVKKIVQNLKSFSRVDEAEYKYTDINECIESTLNIVWNELKYKATVTKEYGELPPTKCYPQQLNQVFMNILVNAAHAIEKQGEIQIRTWNGDGFIKISISDTGSGIPEDKINKIFEPFFTTKPVGKGTGLGLSITYDIVKKHNGEITVDSAVGKGTTFTVRIPVVIEEKKA